jgi:hypothetical protein
MRDGDRIAIGGTIIEFICVIDRFELEHPGPEQTPSDPKKTRMTLWKVVERLFGLTARILRGAVLLYEILTKFCF